MENIKQIIEEAYTRINTIHSTDLTVANAVRTIIDTLDCGGIRVAEKISDEWVVNTWVKKAILLSFRTQKNKILNADWTTFYDKLDLKFTEYTADKFKQEEIRVVPSAIVRKGAYIGKNTVLMPSYVNVGAYIGEGTMVDTWATVGSCAQIGNHVHLSGGVGIGGVLEPLQSNPTIIEDNCFIGARSEIVEGVIIGHGSVISMGVYIGQSTKIYNRSTGEISYGSIPPYSVVIPGSLPGADGTHSTYAAIIIKQVDASTRAKVSINELLRS